MFYYKKLVNRKKLIKFWVFFGNNYKNIFKSNFQNINILYTNYYFLDIKKLVLSLKNILPIFINMVKCKGNLLFVSTKFLYHQTIYKNHYFSIIKKLINVKSGIFTNFSVSSYKSFKQLDFKLNPSLAIFFSLKNNNTLLMESKKKNIPIIGLLTPNINSYLIEYPLFINSLYFYTIFFFHKFFFKIILLNK